LSAWIGFFGGAGLSCGVHIVKDGQRYENGRKRITAKNAKSAKEGEELVWAARRSEAGAGRRMMDVEDGVTLSHTSGIQYEIR
jgi:hypothetical protein